MSGILAGVFGGVVVGALSGSQLGVSGPAAGLIATSLAGLAALGSFEAFCLATLLAGGMQLLLALVKAGTLANYFPTSVIKGMLAAIGIIIILKQLPHLVGLDADYEGDIDFFQADGENTISELGHLLDAVTPASVVIGLLGIGMIILWNMPFIQKNKFLSLIPGPLLAVVIGIVLQGNLTRIGSDMALAPEHLVQIKASSNPVDWITLPDFNVIGNLDVWWYAFLIAVIASVESLLCAEATDKIDPQLRIANKNKELFAQGVGNVFAGLVGALPITQVIVRSSANVQAGGQTRLSAIFHGLLILLAVIAIQPVLNAIPMASLAAVLIMVGYNLVKPSLFKKYYKKGWTQFIPFLVTIPAVFFVDLLPGVGIGIGVAVLFILRRNFRAPYTFVLVESNGTKILKLKLGSIVGFFNKGAIIQTLELVPEGSRVIIDASATGFIDPDIVEVLEDFVQSLPMRKITYELIGSLDHAELSKNPVSDLRKRLQSLAAVAIEPSPQAALKSVDSATKEGN